MRPSKLSYLVPSPSPTPFGAEMRRRREAAGISLRALSVQTGYSVGWLSNMEKGYESRAGTKMPVKTSATFVAAVAQALHWPLADALRTAGLNPGKYLRLAPAPQDDLTPMSSAELLAHAQRFLLELERRLPAEQGPPLAGDPGPVPAPDTTTPARPVPNRDTTIPAGPVPAPNTTTPTGDAKPRKPRRRS